MTSSIVEFAALAFLVVLVVHVSNLGGRVQSPERGMSFLLRGRVPSERARAGRGPQERIEAMRAFRQATGADVKLSIAIIGSRVIANPT